MTLTPPQLGAKGVRRARSWKILVLVMYLEVSYEADQFNIRLNSMSISLVECRVVAVVP